ncbi:MAG: hypothetical protein KME29_03875 [Calothrix sp. FI2-JRJ7]|jgi:hypothetical protein|nr:hypothetical protein [Calothrix sp. FI2-JRJ7]MBW4598759.1 hypothetical protein [Calothrix sp. FI2-JRJ7]
MEDDFNPSPAWDYYLPWHSLHKVQASLDKARQSVKYAKSLDESASTELDKNIDAAIKYLEKAKSSTIN